MRGFDKAVPHAGDRVALNVAQGKLIYYRSYPVTTVADSTVT